MTSKLKAGDNRLKLKIRGALIKVGSGSMSEMGIFANYQAHNEERIATSEKTKRN